MLYNPPTGGAANDSYVGKNVAAGIQGSKIPPAVPEFTQRELVNAITASGQSGTNSDLTQLLQAIAAGGLFVGTFVGTGDALTATIPGNVVIPAARAGMRIIGLVPSPNTGTTPTLAIGGFAVGGSGPIKKRDGTGVMVGDVAAGLTGFILDPAGNWRFHDLVKSDVAANITATQIFNITQQAPPGSGLAATLQRLSFMPTGADSSVLSATFTAPAAGTVQASSILISSPQDGFANAVEIDVNGAPVAQNGDSIAGLIINVAAATVSKGDTVTVKGTVSSSQAATYNTTQRFTYSFIPS